MPGTVQTLLYKIVWDDGDAKKAADAWDSKLKNSLDIASKLVNAFLSISTAIGSFTIDSVKNFAQFEDTLSHARRTMGLSREETLALGDSLMELSTNFEEGGLAAGVTADQLAKISGILGQLGYSTQDNVEQFNSLVAVVAKVGVAFGMSNEKAAEGLGILKNLYDLPVENIENAASSIAYLGNTTVATAGQIMDIMTRMGGIAGLLGVTAQQAAALGATLRESGVRAQVAGTAMSQIFARMASDVDRFGEVLKKGGVSGAMLRMKIESGDAAGALQDVLRGLQNIQAREGKIAATQALKDLGLSGVKVQQALLALSNNLGGLNKNLAASEKAFRENVAVNDAYQSAIDNTWQKWNQFKNLIDVISKLIGGGLAMAFSDFLDNYLIPFTDEFKDWLKVSEGAEAIFGRDGLIASGLDWIGEKLYENKNAFLGWLDTLDKLIPPWIESIKEEFSKAWEKIEEDIGEIVEAIGTFEEVLQDIKTAIETIQETWRIFVETIKGSLQTLENIGKPLQLLYYPLARMNEESKRMKEIYGDMPNEIYKNDAAMNEFVNGIQAATKAGQELGDTMVYHSVLPAIEKKTIEVTKKTVQLGDSYYALTKPLKDIYQAGDNTFTNLSRDISNFSNQTDVSFKKFEATGRQSSEQVQFYLSQTAEAVGNLGYYYKDMGEEAKKTTEIMERASEVAQVMQEAMTKKESKRPTAEQWAGLTSDQVASLWQMPGMMTSSGIQAALESQRAKAGEERQAEITTQQTTQAAQPQPIQVTLQMGDQEIGRVYAVLSERGEQEARRSSTSSGRTSF